MWAKFGENNTMPRGNNNKRREQRIMMQQRMQIVAPLWRKSWTLKEIREEVMKRLGLETYSIKCVHTDVQRLIKEWQEERLENTEDKITAELARIDLVIKEAWLMWEKSKQDYKRKSQMQEGKPRKDPNGQQISVDTIKAMMWDAEQRGSGDPRYLDVILRAMQQRCKLLGLDQQRIDISAATSGAIEIRYVDGGMECASSEEEVRAREGMA